PVQLRSFPTRRSSDLLTVAAGGALQALPAGKVARIMTGAPLPTGADTVLMREETESPSADTVVFKRVPPVGENVRKRGEDLMEGDRKSTRLNSSHSQI